MHPGRSLAFEILTETQPTRPPNKPLSQLTALLPNIRSIFEEGTWLVNASGQSFVSKGRGREYTEAGLQKAYFRAVASEPLLHETPTCVPSIPALQ